MTFPLRIFLALFLIRGIEEVRGTAIDDQKEEVTLWGVSECIKEYYKEVSQRSLFTVEIFPEGEPPKTIRDAFSFDKVLAEMADRKLAFKVNLEDMYALRKTIQKRTPSSQGYIEYVQRVLAPTPYRTSRALRNARFTTERLKYKTSVKIKDYQTKRKEVTKSFISPLLTSEKVLEFILTKNPYWAEEKQKTKVRIFIKEILGE